MANKMTIEEYKEKINNCFPTWDYTVENFSAMKKPVTLICNKCQTRFELNKAEDIFRKVNACKCMKYFKDYHEKIAYLCKVYDFMLLNEDIMNKKVTVQCNKCGTIMIRDRMSILKAPSHCEGCNKYRTGKFHYTKKEVQDKLDQQFFYEYELLEYNGMHNKNLLKHKNCGFIFNISSLSSLFGGKIRGCPKCYQFKSKGEQAIMCFLEENKINYIPQKTFTPLNKSKYRFDFFIPEFNLAIEYQGEQHYYETDWFNENLSSTQKRDEVKRQYCQENNIELLEIPYWKYKDISQILTSRFNDYLNESREKSLETDVATK